MTSTVESVDLTGPLSRTSHQCSTLISVNEQHVHDASGHAFISYVREDQQRVDRLQGILEAAGIEVWRDTANLWPGQDWKIGIRQAIITGSLAFIACFSENSHNRNASYQNEELILAAEQMRLRAPGRSWLIPVRFTDCDIPDFNLGAGRTLNSLHRVDLFGEHWEHSGARLVAAVLRIFGGPLTPGEGTADILAAIQQPFTPTPSNLPKTALPPREIMFRGIPVYARTRAIRRFTVRVTLPEPLAALQGLMLNLRWSWHRPTADLFASIDPAAWWASGGNPVAMLSVLPSARIAALAADGEFGRPARRGRAGPAGVHVAAALVRGRRRARCRPRPRSRTSRPSTASPPRCRSTPAASPSWPGTT